MNFLHNLYKILEDNDSHKVIQLSDASHEIFKAHFPNNPILPGFLQIELFEELFDISIKNIKKAKFLQIITPNMRVSIQKDNKKISILNEDKTKISELVYE